MKQSKLLTVLILLSLAILFSIPAFSAPLGTAFTYQGRLQQSGVAADGDFDFKFNLLDGPDPLSANELASATILAVTVNDGLFTVEIDFGAVFTGDAVWLETEVRPAGVGGLTSLFPPHQLTATPYALNAEKFGGLEVSEVVTMETDPTVNSLAQANLSCSNGQLAKIDGGGNWSCGEDIDTTLSESEVDTFVSNNGYLTSETDPTVNSLAQANLACSNGQIPKVSGSSWVCGQDVDTNTNLSEAQVDTFVSNNGYLTSILWTQIQGGQVSFDGAGRMGVGVAVPQNKLHVDGIIRANGFASSTSNHVCKNGSGALATCSSSQRYKTDIENLSAGMDIIEQLRPVTFRWKDRSELGVGFVAEEVAATAPLFVTHERGQIEGVRYGELTTLLVNALKEQQAAIDQLRALVCANSADQEVCK